MIGCREFERALRSPDFKAPDDAMLRHAEGCARCATSLRADLLLRLGSERPENATTAPGFEARLRARLGAAGPSRVHAGEVFAGSGTAADWSAAVAAHLRPALGAAAALTLIAAALCYQAATGAAGAQIADLTSVLSIDPALGVVLSDDGGSSGGDHSSAGAADSQAGGGTAPGHAARPAGTPR